jgi:hypothetical protein
MAAARAPRSLSASWRAHSCLPFITSQAGATSVGSPRFPIEDYSARTVVDAGSRSSVRNEPGATTMVRRIHVSDVGLDSTSTHRH